MTDLEKLNPENAMIKLTGKCTDAPLATSVRFLLFIISVYKDLYAPKFGSLLFRMKRDSAKWRGCSIKDAVIAEPSSSKKLGEDSRMFES